MVTHIKGDVFVLIEMFAIIFQVSFDRFFGFCLFVWTLQCPSLTDIIYEYQGIYYLILLVKIAGLGM